MTGEFRVVNYNGQLFRMVQVPGTTCWTSNPANASAIKRRREAQHAELKHMLRKLRKRIMRDKPALQ